MCVLIIKVNWWSGKSASWPAIKVMKGPVVKGVARITAIDMYFNNENRKRLIHVLFSS